MFEKDIDAKCKCKFMNVTFILESFLSHVINKWTFPVMRRSGELLLGVDVVIFIIKSRLKVEYYVMDCFFFCFWWEVTFGSHLNPWTIRKAKNIKCLALHGLKWLYRTFGHCSPRGNFQGAAFCWLLIPSQKKKKFLTPAHATVSKRSAFFLGKTETSTRKGNLFITCHFIFYSFL